MNDGIDRGYDREEFAENQEARNGPRLGMLGAIGLGAAGMYFLDPARGKRRRAQIRDKVAHSANIASEAADTTTRDLTNRARGIAHEVRSRFQSEDVSDGVLVARVRTALGRVVSHPSSIIVTANEGHVVLSGPVLAEEVENALARIRSVRGVREVENRLEVHASRGNVPGLQGGTHRTGERFELFQTNWAPATRLVVGATGGALVVFGMGRRDLSGSMLGLAGVALLARAATNTELDRLVGTGGRRRAVDLQKTINIYAPRERVYEFFREIENFPWFMSHVRHVRRHGNGTAYLVLDGPGRIPITWDVQLTRHKPGEYIAWKSTPGSTLESAGTVRFDDNPDGSTRVDIKMTHSPPGGTIGHAVLRLFGSDPKHQLDDDLARVKTYLETGRPAHDAHARELAGT